MTPCGITSVKRGPARLTAPPSQPSYRYGLVFPFQVAPRLAVALCNIRVPGTPIWDYEFGTDAVLFDRLDGLTALQTVELSRNRRFTEPKTGQRRMLLQEPALGGFVPFGARRQDNSPHPHAGTGFAVNHTLEFAVKGEFFDWHDGWINRLEVHQLSCDGRQLRADKTVLTPVEQPLVVPGTDWMIVSPGLTNAIPDGDAMLFPALVENATHGACGVTRWERTDAEWRPTEYLGVTAPVQFRFQGLAPDPIGYWQEPTLIRDGDRDLLFHARGFGAEGNTVRVWRSRDDGRTWSVALDMHGLKREAPTSLNRALDGTPYLANSFPRIGRDLLCLWPLNAARDNIAGLVVARDAADEFGEPPGAAEWFRRRAAGLSTKPDNPDYPDRPNRWWMDHPNGVTLRLADGAWHHVLAFRGLTDSQVHGGALPTPQTGVYMDEVISTGPVSAPWRFDD